MSCSPPPERQLPGGFTLLQPDGTDIDARYDESLLDALAQHGPVASIWQARRSLVVPRSYKRHATFEQACNEFAAQGWPVSVRQTGGGIVPQGKGIINLSLAYPVQGPPMQHSEPGYQLICRLLASALLRMGVESFAAAVEGSFCDGRYNLAAQVEGKTVKIAGTAQSWHRVPGHPDRHLGLVHALVLVDVDTDQLTGMANAFETAIGSERRYQAEKVVSLASLLSTPGEAQARFTGILQDTLRSYSAPAN